MRTGFSGARVAWVASALFALVLPGCSARLYQQASCAGSFQSIRLLEAQAVPSATYIPCLVTLPARWVYGGSEVRSGVARFWLDSDRGVHAVEVSLTRTCDVSGALRVNPSPDEKALRRYSESLTQPLSHAPTQYYLFRGGCVTYRFDPSLGTSPTLVSRADSALGFLPRLLFVDDLHRLGVTLCGAGAASCPG